MEFKNFSKKGRWTVYTGFHEFFKCKEFTKVFQEAIATTKEYLVDKESWAAPFEVTDEGKKWKKMLGCHLWDGVFTGNRIFLNIVSRLIFTFLLF